MFMGASRIAVVAVALSVVGCGSSAERLDSASSSSSASLSDTTLVAQVNDAILDCADGDVLRDAGVRVSGPTEDDVVAQALAAWPGSPPIQLTDGFGKNRWVVVENKRAIAVATPEMNGDGTWVVHDVEACGAPKASPATIDGTIDCTSDRIYFETASFAPDAKSEPDARVAIAAALKPFNERYGGEIVYPNTDTGSLVVGGREQVVARVSVAPAGGYLVGGIEHCEGFA
jgi:hypothetical protein